MSKFSLLFSTIMLLIAFQSFAESDVLEKELLPCVNTTDISAPNASEVGGLGCVQRSSEGKSFTLVVFVQVYCGACKDLVALMPTINSRLGGNTTIRVVVLDRYSEITQNYANQTSLKDVLVANDKTGSSSFNRSFGIRYTPSLILFSSTGEELYRAPLRDERRGAGRSDIDQVANLTNNK